MQQAVPATYGGAIDYWTLTNMTGGVNGVKLHWEEVRDRVQRIQGRRVLRAPQEEERRRVDRSNRCRPASRTASFDRVAPDKIPMTTFGYGLARLADGRVYDWVFPLGTTYWDQMAAMIAYLGQKEGGLDKLKGKKIAFLYHDSAYGKEPIPVLDALAAKLGFEALKIRGHASRPDAGIAMAADPPGEARLRHRLDLRRDEHRGAQDRGEGRLPAAISSSASGGRAPRKTSIPAGDAGQGLSSARRSTASRYELSR